MMSGPSRLAAAASLQAHGARVAALGRQFSGRLAVAGERAAQVLARMQAMRRGGLGVRFVGPSRWVAPAMLEPGEARPVVGRRSDALDRRARVAKVMRAPVLRAPINVGFVGPVPRPVAAAVGKVNHIQASGLRRLVVGPRLAALPVAQSTFAAGGAVSGRGMARAVLPLVSRLAGQTAMARSGVVRRSVGSVPGALAVRSRNMSPMAQPVEAPGFQRTVRQARGVAPAGNVYLDRNLVGYHLAATITAEQTRAAARPNISGAAFNSSMAALRPSGAGL